MLEIRRLNTVDEFNKGITALQKFLLKNIHIIQNG